ncbi:MAG: cyclic pyranopterin monophosphate synthase MoaC [Anaerolineae bacterium]|nr:cyclic pyranopterin monophosphate synthase MoaC [Anaerolineae bacterium]
MIDVTGKEDTLREAIAEVYLDLPGDLKARLQEGRVEKGDALEHARVAAAMAAKKTWDLIPYCHPIPLTGVKTQIEFVANGVRIETLVRTKAPTGVEMEALTAASLAALTIYDMLKMYSQGMVMRGLRLLHKTGGKTGDYHAPPAP